MFNKKILVGLVVFGTLLTSCKKDSPVATPIISICLEGAHFGDHTKSKYILPYSVGESHEIYQSYCGNETHQNQLHYDFLMSMGTNIIASRSGVVIALRENQPDIEPGDFVDGDAFNYINIEHIDGSVAFYAHCKQNYAFVKVGDNIGAGDTIALSGISGTSLPHLHFGVYRAGSKGGGDEAINFRNTTGQLDFREGLIKGESYLALPY